MKRITKQKWLNALRSGKYKQSDGCLKNSRGYCCLGVLAEITGNLRVPGIGFPKINKFEDPLPFCGLSPIVQRKLAEMNDVGDPFSEIAAYISKNVKTED